LLAGGACLLARGLAGRDRIYQLILWVSRWDTREPSLARSLAATRAAHRYPPDGVFNTAGNRVISLNAGRAKFQMKTAVAVWQHARRSDPASRGAGMRRSARGVAPGRIRNPGWCQQEQVVDPGQDNPEGA